MDKMMKYNNAVKLFVLIIAFCASISWTMDVTEIDKEIATLKGKCSDMKHEIAKKSGGDSTMAYRWCMKANADKFSEINQQIKSLERTREIVRTITELKSKL
jgi:hypothetical protein